MARIRAWLAATIGAHDLGAALTAEEREALRLEAARVTQAEQLALESKTRAAFNS